MNTDKEKQYRHIDQAFADFILRLSGRKEDSVIEKTMLELSSAVSGGASCIEVADELKTYLLENCAGAVGEYQTKGLALPLILDGNYLYFQKLLKYEVQLAELFLDIAKREVPALPEEADADKLFSSLEEEDSTEEKRAAIRTQKEAVKRALAHPLSVICGGPGTGKTTVASALLAMELQRTAPERIALLAPTGKAHVRLKESLLEDSQKFDIPENIRKHFENLPGGTIHRFLAWGSHGPKYNAENPAPYDLILVDECSMISLHTMTTLLSALEKTTRVVLLGDAAQLASIDAGLIFSDLCQASSEAQSGPLKGIVSTLTYNFRAEKAGELIALAENLREGKLPESTVIPATPPLKKFAETFTQITANARQIRDLCEKQTPESLDEAFRLLEEHKIICPVTQNNPFGTQGINKAVLKTLDIDENSYGVPVMIRHNNYDLELFNGDTGLIVPGKKVVFPGKEEPLPLAVLPEYDIAYAITAHKSQGSGYKNVLLLLPEEEHKLVNRPLIYTAVTRARFSAVIYGSRKVIETALKDTGHRASGLAQRLLKLNSLNKD